MFGVGMATAMGGKMAMASVRRQRLAGFSPADMFRSGEQGGWYDPSDFSTMFQDSSALTPATATTQPVGFLGDKRTGALFGQELVTNGTFDSSTTGWAQANGTIAAVGGQLQVTTNGNFSASGSQTIPTVIGQTYKVSGRLAKGTCINTIRVDVGVSTAGTGGSTTPTDFAFTYTATGTSTIIACTIGGNETGTTAFFDNISVRPWAGNHPIQGTAASRPTLQQPAYLALRADGVDDSLAAPSGGGGTVGFLLCAAITLQGGAGTARTLWSDTGTNAGYRVRINASNQLELAAGNGTSFTTAATTDALSVGTTYVVMAWHDGASLNVQVNNGAVAQAAFGTATAGTAGFTLFKDNGASTSLFNVDAHAMVYQKDSALAAEKRARLKSWVAAKVGLPL